MNPILLFAGVLLSVYGVAALGGGGIAASSARRKASKPLGVVCLVTGAVLIVIAAYRIMAA